MIVLRLRLQETGVVIPAQIYDGSNGASAIAHTIVRLQPYRRYLLAPLTGVNSTPR